MPSVLIVEDDPVMLRGLKDNYARRGYSVRTASDGLDGLDAALDCRPDLLVLDLMLPHMNGYEVCRNLRAEEVEVPTIMLTAKSEETDMLLGFGVGADDYVTKPFSVRELIARSEALLRRSGGAGNSDGGKMIRFGNWEIDGGARQLRRVGGTDEVPLSPKEYALLEYLASRPGRALSREQIMNSVWGYGCVVTHRSIDRFVTTLRKKIEREPEHPEHILTVRNFGYRFVV